MAKLTRKELQLLQSLPLEDKIKKSQLRIEEWKRYFGDSIYVSFSGGKDSTVLLHLVRSMYPQVPAVFCDTGLEYPEIREFVQSTENIAVIRPSLNFREVIEKYGYPVISKEQAGYINEIRNTKSDKLRDIRLNGSIMPDGTRSKYGVISKKWQYLIDAPFKISNKCCWVMKKKPFEKYEKETGNKMITGEIANESSRRTSKYLTYGCNAFETIRPKSTPIAFWTEQDILRYLQEFKVPFSAVYGDIIDKQGQLSTSGCQRTGCMFCMFGVHLDPGENRFQKMSRSHPQLYKYCINQLGIGKVLDYIKVPY